MSQDIHEAPIFVNYYPTGPNDKKRARAKPVDEIYTTSTGKEVRLKRTNKETLMKLLAQAMADAKPVEPSDKAMEESDEALRRVFSQEKADDAS